MADIDEVGIETSIILSARLANSSMEVVSAVDAKTMRTLEGYR